jgi:hypothetical protein
MNELLIIVAIMINTALAFTAGWIIGARLVTAKAVRALSPIMDSIKAQLEEQERSMPITQDDKSRSIKAP